jgi:hypothetical protein
MPNEGGEGMSEGSGPTLSVAALFAERDARRRREQEAEENLKRKKEEELVDFRKRLEEFQITDTHLEAVFHRINRAFERGETELMLTTFPSSFCTDDGRAINNAGAPPINKPDKDAPQPSEPEWLSTLPKGAWSIYQYWKQHLQPGGFTFTARIINYPDGKPGYVGLFFGWPKNTMEA